MKSNELRDTVAIILAINIFVIFAAIRLHAIPFWGMAIMADIIGLFCGFFIGFMVKLQEDKNKNSNH